MKFVLKPFISIALLFLTINSTFSQPKTDLYKIPADAFALYKAKNYAGAANLYSFFLKESIKGKLYNKNIYDAAYNGACCWALANKPDSAFIILDIIADKDVDPALYPQILKDDDLSSLYNDQRWGGLIEKIKTHQNVFESGIDKKLVLVLDSLRDNDQKYRRLSAQKVKEFGASSKEAKDAWNLTLKNDSTNLIRIKDLIGKYGWLGPRKVGFKGNKTIFLIIQHADLTTQEKYFPVMEQAIKVGDAFPGDLAFLQDRILLRKRKMQIYGTQLTSSKEKPEISFPQNLQDPDNVDLRRFRVGLGPMSEYLSPDKWDPTEYKKLYQKQ